MKQVLSVADFATIMNLVDKELSNYRMPNRSICLECGIDYEQECAFREKELQNNSYYQNLKHLKESLQNYIMENPGYESEIKKIIEYIDSNYIGGKSFYNSVKDILNFCMSDGQIGMQLATVGVSTASVVTSCWFTGIVGVLQNAYFAIIDFIPKWLVITTNSISIVL